MDVETIIKYFLSNGKTYRVDGPVGNDKGEHVDQHTKGQGQVGWRNIE